MDLVVNDTAGAFGDRKLHHAAVRPQQNDDCRSVPLIQDFPDCQLLRERLPVAAVGDPLLAAVTAGEQGNRQKRPEPPEAQDCGLHQWRSRCPEAGGRDHVWDGRDDCS